jgi:hypothetical protein
MPLGRETGPVEAQPFSPANSANLKSRLFAATPARWKRSPLALQTAPI